MAASVPLIFGSILTGAVVLDYGVKSVRAGAAGIQSAAGSGDTGGGGAPAGALPLNGKHVNPFGKASGFMSERTDMGVDASMHPGSPIVAPFDSEYLGTIPNWYNGQPYIAFRILSGSLTGKVYYLSEQINPANFQVGQKIGAGTRIATFASSGTGIEMGLADPANWRVTLAKSTTGYREGEKTPAGLEWRRILAALGVDVSHGA